MNNKIQNGFTIIEVIVSITFFSILASSIYLISSFLIASNKIVSEDYISELFYRSYMERYKLKDNYKSKFEDSLYTFGNKKNFKIEVSKTPNSNILLIRLNPKNEPERNFTTYMSKFW